MESQNKQEISINNFLHNYSKEISHNFLKPITSIEEINNILFLYFYNISNSLDNIHINEYVKQSLINIKFLIQTSNFIFDNCDLLLIIKTLLTIYSKTDEDVIRNDIIDLIIYVNQHDQFVSLYIIKETNFIQD